MNSHSLPFIQECRRFKWFYQNCGFREGPPLKLTTQTIAKIVQRILNDANINKKSLVNSLKNGTCLGQCAVILDEYSSSPKKFLMRGQIHVEKIVKNQIFEVLRSQCPEKFTHPPLKNFVFSKRCTPLLEMRDICQLFDCDKYCYMLVISDCVKKQGHALLFHSSKTDGHWFYNSASPLLGLFRYPTAIKLQVNFLKHLQFFHPWALKRGVEWGVEGYLITKGEAL